MEGGRHRLHKRSIRSAPATPDLVQLDRYDTAYLNELLPDWKRDETRAKVIKWHWIREESAATIDSQHRTKDGKIQKGYSERAIGIVTGKQIGRAHV